MTDNMAMTNGMDKDKENAQRKKHGGEGGLKNGKEFTVAVELMGEDKVTKMEILRSIKEVCGEVVGCRMKGERKYEITMRNGKGRDRLMDGLMMKDHGERYDCKRASCIFHESSRIHRRQSYTG